MVPRTGEIQALTGLLRRHVIVGILGARQLGKSTLARMVAKTRRGPITFFDLEADEDLARLTDPMLALKGLGGLVIIDEIQHRPDLFRVLRVLADRTDTPCRFLVLGSASPELLKQSRRGLVSFAGGCLAAVA